MLKLGIVYVYLPVITIFYFGKSGGTSPRSGGSGDGPEIGSFQPKSGAITCLSEEVFS